MKGNYPMLWNIHRRNAQHEPGFTLMARAGTLLYTLTSRKYSRKTELRFQEAMTIALISMLPKDIIKPVPTGASIVVVRSIARRIELIPVNDITALYHQHK